MKFKGDKGITLVSLIIYVIGLIVIMGIIAFATSFYQKNVLNLNNSGEVNSEFNKFNSKMIEETKEAGNEVESVTENVIKFSNGNTYTLADEKIYQNLIVVCKNVKEFLVDYAVDGNKQILKIYIRIGKGKVEVAKTVSYVVEIDKEEVKSGSDNVWYNKKTTIVDSNGLATKNETIIPDKTNNPNLQIVIPEGFAPAILKTGTLQSLPGENGEVDHKMPAEQWNNITVEDINKGIVVVDVDGNEFVWIPITDSNKFARVAWTTAYGFDENGTSKSDLTTPHPLSEEISPTIGWWEDKSATNTEYTNMVKSVKINKGFYVARYEASANSDSSKAQSKRNQTAWYNISQLDAIIKSASYNTTLHSHLMYGIEWDSILKWLEGNATISSSIVGETKIMDESDLQTDSCSWGNYKKSTGDAAANIGSKRKTGTSEYWKANNIYDLAGNIFELTQEKWSQGTVIAIRGGNYNTIGVNYPVAIRSDLDESKTSGYGGFRISFYL